MIQILISSTEAKPAGSGVQSPPEPPSADGQHWRMVMCQEEFRKALAKRDPQTLRRMAEQAAEEQTQLSLFLIAEIVESQNRTSRPWIV